MSISLKAGWNEWILYPGVTQSVEAAFASIQPYLMIVYYWTGEWWITPTTMVTGNYYSIKVTQDCVWTFEMPGVVPCEITIDAPGSAEEDETVNVSATIKNVSPYNYSYRTEIFAGATLLLSTDDIITSGSSKTYNAPFVMPGTDITILVWVERWSFDHWAYDNSASKVVSLAAPPPEVYEGTITKKELDYEDIWQALPLYNIPAGTRTRVRITGRNDTSETQRMGIYWFVADPDGDVVQEYSTWEAWPYTGPGAEHQFIGSSFDLDKPGKYTTWVELIMNPGDPEVVDRYIGDLCTVEAVVEEFAGTLTRKELDYDAVRVPFPVQ